MDEELSLKISQSTPEQRVAGLNSDLNLAEAGAGVPESSKEDEQENGSKSTLVDSDATEKIKQEENADNYEDHSFWSWAMVISVLPSFLIQAMGFG